MRRIILTALLIALAGTASAETAFQFTTVGPTRLPDDANVNGFRLALFYGQADSMKGFDMGFASLNRSTNYSGVGFVFGISQVTGKSSGCLCSLVNLNSGDATGITAGFINKVKNMQSGANIGIVNLTDDYSHIDISGLAISQKSKMQFGFVNVTDEIEGFQIGFLNMAQNGFFPVFPLFNFPKK